MADQLGSYPQFRLNLEQQRKRAKELLKATRSGVPEARARFHSVPQLAEAQHLIAQELRFGNWTSLKQHIAAMTRERDSQSILDHDLRTLHIRCGSDLAEPLQQAGFRGDFYEHNYPYLIGPVCEGPGCLEQRARFIVEAYSDNPDSSRQFEAELLGLQRADQLLHDSSEYERVVIWSEFDCYDQLALVRLLGHYATQPRPDRLELVNVDEFPGAIRFIGLGQLPPEALRLLWATRTAATPEVLNLGLQTWRALVDPDPRALATIMRGGTPALPLLAKALHRHLRELPSSVNGLSLTQEMSLQLLLAEGETTLMRLIGRQVYELDPLPGQGDSNVRYRLLSMEDASARVFERHPGDRLSITGLGRAVLAGEVDFLSLQPPNRWVGGVEIGHGLADWRWNERGREPIFR